MILPALGITDMFEQTEANFKGISGKLAYTTFSGQMPYATLRA